MKLILENTSFAIRQNFKETKNISQYYQKNKFVGNYQIIGYKHEYQKEWFESMIRSFLKNKRVVVRLKVNFNFINWGGMLKHL
jgi:hypothetical protein